MSRRLVICVDGTWNTEHQTDDGILAPTNVWKIKDALKPLEGQLVHYVPGVGTNGIFDKFFGGAFGRGIDDQIFDCYKFLIDHYQPGDEIFLFGFSRGAYAVRSLAGMLRNCGLLHQQEAGRLKEAYELYRDRSNETHPRNTEKFRLDYSHQVKVKFLGIWDTVGALGIPDIGIGDWFNQRYQFHDVKLSSTIENAFHAIAIDERRKPFAPTLWQEEHNPGQMVEQCWFAGVHSDVGGGYKEHGLSDISLKWMMDRADHYGLEFDPTPPDLNPSPLDLLHDSLRGIFRKLPDEERQILGYRRARRDFLNRPAQTIHESVGERMRHQPYAPNNVLAYQNRTQTRQVRRSTPMVGQPLFMA
jgi:uncharacterized protein (DUF2235 family)